jgi:XTP/dITP diphosphohydrolase
VRPRLVLATRNAGKLNEYRALLAADPVDLLPLDEAGGTEAEETGQSYAENARLKACAAAVATRLPALADDSGLEIAGLGGAPGIHSTRFAGPGTTAQERLRIIIERVRPLPEAQRAARFVCALALALPGGGQYEFAGFCKGLIVLEPRGSNGFGYDPIFYLPDQGRTMAELDAATKNRVSHRARAVKGLHWSGVLQRLDEGTLH